jgi:hypothetical protein
MACAATAPTKRTDTWRPEDILSRKSRNHQTRLVVESTVLILSINCVAKSGNLYDKLGFPLLVSHCETARRSACRYLRI